MNAPGTPSTIEFAAARLRHALGSRSTDCITSTDASLCDDDGSYDAMLYFMVDGQWIAVCVAAAHVPDGQGPRDILRAVLAQADEMLRRARRAHLTLVEGGVRHGG